MIPDYELALQYVLYGKWDNLFTLMLRSKDDVLRKKIHQFLHAYYYAPTNEEIIQTHDRLLFYIDHAIQRWITLQPDTTSVTTSVLHINNQLE